MIWDVLDICENKIKWEESQEDMMIYINSNWTKKRKPIEEQVESCIDYIYNLIQETNEE